MFLLLLVTSIANAIPAPCRLAEIHVDLPLYVGISQTLAAKGLANTSVLYASEPDPMFDGDEHIEFRLVPSTAAALVLVVTHREAIAIGEKPVAIAEISDSLVIDLAGNVDGGHSCEVRLAMATQALDEMKKAYTF